MIRLLFTISLFVSIFILSTPVLLTSCYAAKKSSKNSGINQLNSFMANSNYKVLVLVRHGKASKKNKVTADKRPKGSKKAKQDMKRPLVKKGLKASNKLAKLMSKIDFQDVGIWGSIANRVQETAKPVIQTLGNQVLFQEFEEDLYYADVPIEMKARLTSPTSSGLNHAIFFGHGGTTMELFDQLTGTKKSFLPTAGAVFIVIKAEHWGEVFKGTSEHIKAFAWSPNDTHTVKGSDVPVTDL